MLMEEGTLTLERFSGTERFSVSEATILSYEDEGQIFVCFEIETAGEPLATLPDTRELRARPDAEFNAVVPSLDWDHFVGANFDIGTGLDDEGEWRARLYYCEHQPAEQVEISVLEAKDRSYRVKIHGRCADVNHYDGSKPETKITVDAWFSAPPSHIS